VVERHNLQRFVEGARIRAAIVAAEGETSVPIAVSIAPYFWGSLRRTAERAFRKRRGVLIFVVPSRREFAVLGDAAVHDALGQSGWDAVAATIGEHFRSGDPTRGLELAIDQLGRRLAQHFPS
jgi:uncharacterized membrane protein